MWSVVVVVVDEGVELGLELGDRGWLVVGRGASVFMVCWKRSTLPQVVGWLGREFFWRTRSRTSSVSRPLRLVRPPWAKRVVNTKPLSVKVENGVPWRSTAARKVATTAGPVTGRWAVTDRA